jgi:hypothetical protein
MFSLDKLKVYEKALANTASLARYSRSWDKRHAVTDQLLRASESVVLNPRRGRRLRSAAKRQHRDGPAGPNRIDAARSGLRLIEEGPPDDKCAMKCAIILYAGIG